MSSCRLGSDKERFDEIRSIRTDNAGLEVEARLWEVVYGECLLGTDLGGVIDMAFHVDRKGLVIGALKNVIARLEQT
jgi:hypothetical protein